MLEAKVVSSDVRAGNVPCDDVGTRWEMVSGGLRFLLCNLVSGWFMMAPDGEIRMGCSGEENTAATARRGLFEASWKEVLLNEENSADTPGRAKITSVLRTSCNQYHEVDCVCRALFWGSCDWRHRG